MLLTGLKLLAEHDGIVQLVIGLGIDTDSEGRGAPDGHHAGSQQSCSLGHGVFPVLAQAVLKPAVARIGAVEKPLHLLLHQQKLAEPSHQNDMKGVGVGVFVIVSAGPHPVDRLLKALAQLRLHHGSVRAHEMRIGDRISFSPISYGGKRLVVVQQVGQVRTALVHGIPQLPIILSHASGLIGGIRRDLLHEPVLQNIHRLPEFGAAGKELRRIASALLQRQVHGMLHIGDAGVAGAALNVFSGAGAE